MEGAFHDGEKVVEELMQIVQVEKMSFTVRVKKNYCLSSDLKE